MSEATPITPGQKRQYRQLVQAAARKAANKALSGIDLDKITSTQLQRVIESGDEIAECMVAPLGTKLLEMTQGRYANEELPSNWEYPPEYTGPKPILEQVTTLKEIFPELDVTQTIEFIEKVLPTLGLPSGAEGWFAIPRWEKLGATYGETLERVIATIKSRRACYNYRDGTLGEKYLRQLKRSVTMLAEVAKTQPGDVLIIPAQFGKRHRGRSVRRDREVFAEHEFGLGAVAVGSMLLTHPERLVRWEQLHVDCAGDEYSFEGDGQFTNAPFFYHCASKVRFNTDSVDDAYRQFGTASGFVPQSKP